MSSIINISIIICFTICLITHKHISYFDIFNQDVIINDITVSDENGIHHRISELTELNKELFVLYFSEENCISCVDEYLSIFNEISLKIGKNSILIFAEYSNIRSMLSKKYSLNVNLSFYQVKDDLGLNLYNSKGHKRLWMGILSDNLHIYNFRLGEVTDSITSSYFDDVINNFINNH